MGKLTLYEDAIINPSLFYEWFRIEYWIEAIYIKENCKVNFYNLEEIGEELCAMTRFERLDGGFSYSYCPLKFIK